MSPHSKIRLFAPVPYEIGKQIDLTEGQSHYLSNVMRQQAGDTIALFNGHDGEWVAEIAAAKKQISLRLIAQQRPQKASPDLWLAFAPIKNKTDLVVEKATELGVSKIMPVFTQHAVVRSVNMEKLTAHAVEAAEQCERMDVPVIETTKDIPTLLSQWPRDRTLFYGDESGKGESLKDLLAPPLRGSGRERAEGEVGAVGGGGVDTQTTPPASSGAIACSQPPSLKERAGILIGPEGGFSVDEQKLLHSLPFVKPFSMGPRILRADTAAVAALACVQAWLGDWEEKPA